MQPLRSPWSWSVTVEASGLRSGTCTVLSWVVEAAVNAAVASWADRCGCAVAWCSRHATSVSVAGGITGGKKSWSAAIGAAHWHGPVASR